MGDVDGNWGVWGKSDAWRWDCGVGGGAGRVVVVGGVGGLESGCLSCDFEKKKKKKASFCRCFCMSRRSSVMFMCNSLISISTLLLQSLPQNYRCAAVL